MTPADLTAGQRQALEELDRIQAASMGALTYTATERPPDAEEDTVPPDWLTIGLRVAYPDEADLLSWEETTVFVPPDFPFRHPEAAVGRAELGTLPHVLWGRWICLYVDENAWDVGDGMYGYVERLVDWYLRAADGSLDPAGQPLHPPVTYASDAYGTVVVTPDGPVTHQPLDGPWLGAAVVYRVSDWRTDVIGWLDLFNLAEPESILATLKAALAWMAEKAGIHPSRCFLAPTIILSEPMSFEFPRTLRALVGALGDRDVDPRLFLMTVGSITKVNAVLVAERPPETQRAYLRPPLITLVGSPRVPGATVEPADTYLSAWRLTAIDEASVRLLTEIISMGRLETLTSHPIGAVLDAWLHTAACDWAIVYDQRPSVAIRRDAESGASWLHGKRVLVLGCGALGAPIAEHCARAGAAELTLVDNAQVRPGLLVRQPYLDGHIGHAKAQVLAIRLRHAAPRTAIRWHADDVLDGVLAPDAPLPDVDLIIDATANAAVAARLELNRAPDPAAWPAVLTVGIGFEADRGVATLALPGASGAGRDLLRRVAVHAWREQSAGDPTFKAFVDDLFPARPPQSVFQPEYGCSATFHGSAADCAGLAGLLLAGALRDLAGQATASMSARLVDVSDGSFGAHHLRWSNDAVVHDEASGYRIRLSAEALESMRGQAVNATTAGFNLITETGGLLLGQIDDACRVVYVTAAEGPPGGSELSPTHFRVGAEGVDACIARHREHSGNRVGLIGVWHTHPFGAAKPSEDDASAVDDIVRAEAATPPRLLMVILGSETLEDWPAWLRGGSSRPAIHASLHSQPVYPPK